MKLWGGRFQKETDLGFLEFSSSVQFDVRLYPYDVACTRAWSDALNRAGVISDDEIGIVHKALDSVLSELDEGSFSFLPSDEDIHTAVERRMVEIAGPVAGKIRTGRSRNDQVATDMRLMAIDACGEVLQAARGLQSALLATARDNIDIIVPGHTHLQQAQPVLFSHSVLSFAQMLERDVLLLSGAIALADSMPLGSGAIAGTTFEVDREQLASDLGFSRVSANSMDSVSDRDFICAGLFAFSMIMTHLSRLSEQIILWCSTEFGILKLDDAWSTGSSLMPQKKNPDGCELARGKTGRVFGALFAMLTVLKGLPLTYNRDLQEDKEGFFDAWDTTRSCLEVLSGTVSTVVVDASKASETVMAGFMTATDLADYLVAKGMEFPAAHQVVGEVVSYCVSTNRDLASLDAPELSRFSTLLDQEALEWLAPEASIARRSLQGGTSREAVLHQLNELERKLLG